MKENQDFFTSSLDYKKVIHRLISFKNTYLILIGVLLVLAFLVNKYSEIIYKNSTTIYMNEADKAQSLNSTNDMFQSFGLFGTKENIANELEIIKSFTLIKKVINEADLKVSYFSYNSSPIAQLLFKTPFTLKTELYDKSPVVVIPDISVPQAIYLNFFITFLNESEFLIETDGEEIPLYNYIDDQVVSHSPVIHFKQRFKFGDEIKSRYFNFRIQKTSTFNKEYTQDRRLFFFLNNINDLALQYQNELVTETTSEKSTLIRISLTGANKQRITDVLNSLTSAYLGNSLNKKNKTALSTIDFIDSQISDIADSLNYAESALKNFRTSEGVMDLSFQGQQIFEQLNKLENEKASLAVQKKYYEYLNNYLGANQEVSDIMAPSSMNVVDPMLNNLVGQVLSLNAEKASLLRNTTSQQNLYLADINIRIENLRKTIKETVRNTLNTLNISLNEINYRMSKASGQISQIPKTELQLKGIERKFKLNDDIYTFLLQKRSEAQIARASSLPDYEVVDPAVNAISKAIYPKRLLNYLLAILIGFFLPTFFIMGKDFLNNKITGPEEAEGLTNFPILGKVFHNFHRSKMVVNDHPNSSVTESFRAVRTNFEFFSEGGKRQVILITSSTSGEGKTFCSINLASVFALNGHKTVLLEFDLHRPKIHQEFGSSNIIGITSFLIDKALIEDIILPTNIDNLDIISAGPAAPNPSELIGKERTGELFDKLKEMYDFIIIDSAPAGILAETQLLMKYTDLNIFVARINKTIKETFRISLKSIENNKISNVTILINDLDIKRDSYKYGYDSKYYSDDKKIGFFNWVFQKRKKETSS
jgi:tyrosine-protein kinase Etk/Wzc